MPPGLNAPGDFLIALDCRAIFQGWQQYLVRDFFCPHSALAEFYDTFAPDGFHVQIEGAELTGDNLIVGRGQVLTLVWAPFTPDSASDAILAPTLTC